MRESSTLSVIKAKSSCDLGARRPTNVSVNVERKSASWKWSVEKVGSWNTYIRRRRRISLPGGWVRLVVVEFQNEIRLRQTNYSAECDHHHRRSLCIYLPRMIWELHSWLVASVGLQLKNLDSVSQYSSSNYRSDVANWKNVCSTSVCELFRCNQFRKQFDSLH